MADPDGDVQALVHQVDDPVHKYGLCVHQRIVVEKVAQNRGDMNPPEQEGRGDAQFAARRGVRANRRIFRFLQVRQDPPAIQ